MKFPKFMIFLKLINFEFLYDHLFLGLGLLPATTQICKFSDKQIANRALRAISNLHIRNFDYLQNKTNILNMENKSLACLDIKPLYTNLPINKCIEHLEIHLKKSNITFTFTY